MLEAVSMASNSSWRSNLWLLISLLIIFACNFSLADALTQSLCSSQNTGADSQPVSDDYQSNGKCFDTCKANYAFAVVQAKNCWCSNYIPADTTSVGSCNVPCPGYPFEKCGSSGFFGYVPLNKAPSGTLGASQSQSPTSSPVQPVTSKSLVVSSPGSPYLTSRSSPSSIKVFSSASAMGVGHLSPTTLSELPSTSQPSRLTTAVPSMSMVLTSFVQTPPTPDPVTIQHTVTRSPPVEVSFVSITPSATPETTTETATPAQPTTHYVPVPIPVSPSSSPSPSTTATPSTPTSSSSQASPPPTSTWTPTPITSVMTITGQVKTVTITPTAPPSAAADSRSGGFMSHPGKVAGLFVGVGLIICALAGALIWFYLRWKRNAETETIASTGGGGTPQRRQSKLSTMGLLGGTRKSNMRKSVPPIQTGGWGPGNSHEKSPSDTPIDYRRTSYPRVVDQRLDPMALWNPLQDNGSHVSIQSFRDDQDYSRRMLRVANPDDRPHSRE